MHYNTQDLEALLLRVEEGAEYRHQATQAVLNELVAVIRQLRAERDADAAALLDLLIH